MFNQNRSGSSNNLANQVVSALADESIPAPWAVQNFRALILHDSVHKNSLLPLLVGEILHDNPEFRASDSPLPRRMACAIVLNGITPGALRSEFAFSGSFRQYRRGVKKIVQAAAAFESAAREKIERQARGEEAPEGKAANDDVDLTQLAHQHQPDRLLRSISAEIDKFVGAVWALVDLGKEKQMPDAFVGVLVERLVVAVEDFYLNQRKRSLGTALEDFFLKEVLQLLAYRPEHSHRLYGRTMAGTETGLTLEPYYTDPDRRELVRDPNEPARFWVANVERDEFRTAAKDTPGFLLKLCS